MANKPLNTIKKILSKHKKALAKKYHITQLGIFGSYARGENKKNSDIDILVEFSKVPGFSFMSLELELEKLLGKKVDLVRKKAIRPELRRYILDDVVFV